MNSAGGLLTDVNCTTPVLKGELEAMLEGLLKEMDPVKRASILGRSLLSDRAILRHMEQGTIVVDPFIRENLGTASYDVTLGEWHYKEWRSDMRSAPALHGQDVITAIFNPYDETHVHRIWGEPQRAKTLAESELRLNGELKNIRPDDQVIWIFPGETILCHTQEFIGGREPYVTTMMKARSSVGRVFIEVCKCAGWGDVNFFNRWTMEFTNNSTHYALPLVVGRRVGQMAFFEVEPIAGRNYVDGGKYQSTADIAELKARWKPEMMLPRLYRDREVVAAALGSV